MANRNWERERGPNREANWNREGNRSETQQRQWAGEQNAPQNWGQYRNPESEDWREGFRGGFGNSGQMSRAAYNRGGLGAGYDQPSDFSGPGGGFEAGQGFEGRPYDKGNFEGGEYGRGNEWGAPRSGNYYRGGPAQWGGPESGYQGGEYGGSRGFENPNRGYENPNRGGYTRPHEASWAERAYGARGTTGGFAGHEYDWTTRGERAGYGMQGGGYSSDMETRGGVSGPYSGRGPRGYQRSDERVHEEVCERLTEHGAIDASNVDVRCENGEITLEGTVSDRRAKRLAEEIAESARGVRDVHNRLRVTGRDNEESESGETRSTGRSGTEAGENPRNKTTDDASRTGKNAGSTRR
jgi:hypothetical protein